MITEFPPVRFLLGRSMDQRSAPTAWAGYEQAIFIDLGRAQRQQDAAAHRLLANHVTKCVKRVEVVLHDSKAKFLRNLFLPAPGFPIVHAKRMYPGDSQAAASSSILIGGQVSVVIPKDVNCGLSEIIFGSFRAWLSWRGNKIFLNVGENSISLPRSEEPVHVALIRTCVEAPWKLMLYSSLGCESQTLRTVLEGFYNVEFRQTRGEGLVVQLQGIGERGGARWLPCADERRVEPLSKSAPHFVLAWEEQARRIWHLSLDVAVAMDALNQVPDLLTDTLRARSLFLTASRLLFAALGSARYWRPSASTDPQAGPWERGNWASGFMTGAYGILLTLLSKSLSDADKSRARSVIVDRGLLWLRLPENDESRRYRFPPVRHWLSRSTNHGIMILASALTGLRLSSTVVDIREYADFLHSLELEFEELCRLAFADGFYVEGNRYGQLCLQEASAYLLQRYSSTSESWQSIVSRCFPEIKEIGDFIWLSGHPLLDRPFANWGDCREMSWNHSAISLLSSVVPEASARFASWLPFEQREAVHISETEGEDKTRGPLAFALRCLQVPEESVLDRVRGQYGKVWYRGGTAVLARDSECLERDWRLWLLATKVHRTHNIDHDIGSLFLNVGGTTWIGEERGRHAAAHSTIALIDPNKARALNSIDPSKALFFGSRKNGNDAVRDHSAIIEWQHIGDFPVLSAVAQHGLYKLEDGRVGVRDYRVDVLSLEEEGAGRGAFLVLRQALMSPDTFPCHSMIFPQLLSTDIRYHPQGRILNFHGMGSVGFFTPLPFEEVGWFAAPLRLSKMGMRVIETYEDAPELLQTVQLIQIGAERWHLSLDCAERRLASIHLVGPNGTTINLAPGKRQRRRAFTAPTVIDVE